MTRIGATAGWRHPWRTLVGSWPCLSAATVGHSLWLGWQPATWRRPVADEFWRFAGLAGPGALAAMAIAGAVVGVGLVGQAIFWLEQIGQREVVVNSVLVLLIREVAPLVVGLVLLGGVGLRNVDELAGMRAAGTVRVLEAQGLDPFVLFALPRTLALGVCALAHAVIFLVVCVLTGYAVARALGVALLDLFGAAALTLSVIGDIGVLVLPAKTLLIGFAIAAVTTVTALVPANDDAQVAPVGRAFFRAFLAILLISLVGSLTL